MVDQLKPLTLEKEVEHTIEEARMVLPGIQALFGFQLIAVFSERFESALDPATRWLHLGAIACVAISIALIMAPAAFDRQVARGFVSAKFSVYASRTVTTALIPLMVAIVVEIWVVASVITDSIVWSSALAAAMLLTYLGLWFVIPQLRQRKKLAHHAGARFQEAVEAERSGDELLSSVKRN